ncbi:MAG: class I SAM-dependent methyltransferase [Candidatus Schekmanbacteria bacterium]|nr:class I SAM-dependent methyltransferase [Candidatus Schekmanbacteria bacterium]
MAKLEGQKELIRYYWNNRPCGTKTSDSPIGSKQFFEEVEKQRYEIEYYLPQAVDFTKYKGKNLLEIGCGLGTDSLRFARNGSNVTAVDLTFNGVSLAKKRFGLYQQAGRFSEMDMQKLAFKDNTFDVVYSCGVIHHTPNIGKTIDEIYRVLKPGGEIVIMIYHKNSYYYYGSIMFFKKIGFRLLGWDIDVTPEEWLAFGTDGFGTPYSEVFTRDQAKALFKKFKTIKTKTFGLSSKDIPLINRFFPQWLDYQLAKLWGFCLFVYAVKE